jgi:hypothetical protein
LAQVDSDCPGCERLPYGSLCEKCGAATAVAINGARAWADQQPASAEELWDLAVKSSYTANPNHGEDFPFPGWTVVHSWGVRAAEQRLGIAAPEPAKAKEE